MLMAAVVIAALVVAVPGLAVAASYTGYGETAFEFSSKAECCERAVTLAQQNSARNCERSGGYADYRRTSARGRCSWKTKRGSGGRSIYGCTATATVPCR